MRSFFRRARSRPAVKYVQLGSAGLRVSNICLGTMSFGTQEWQRWTINQRTSRSIVKAALESGINFFDTADVYSNGASEEILGRALRDLSRRDQVVIATKVNGPMGTGPNDRGLSRKHILDAADASLKRLGTDYIDLYQIHRWDYEVPIEETLGALNDLVRAGKVRYIGASSMYAWEFAKSLYTADLLRYTRFVSMQNHYNLVYREEEREMIPLCKAEGVALLPWSPLARGFLAGNRSRTGWGETLRAKTDDYAHRLYYRESDFCVADRTVDLARRRSVKPVQIALAWMMSKPWITSPVIGATNPEHVEEAVSALGVSLASEEVSFLEEPYVPHPVLGHP
ncbi:MAG TPA: aldo/keto reductase [Terriglobia bacterium]|nr:aldo/keto reductase [Terriglobia bacterium]